MEKIRMTVTVVLAVLITGFVLRDSARVVTIMDFFAKDDEENVANDNDENDTEDGDLE